jgi:putative holliday junction resolvase
MILGVDPGRRRVGLAVGNLETLIAVPLETIDAAEVDPITRIVEVCGDIGATLIVVGLPLSLSGHRGPQTVETEAFAELLRAAAPVEVRVHDERLTTVVAERALRAAGASAPRRKKLRDAVAAQAILQGYLDAHPRS